MENLLLKMVNSRHWMDFLKEEQYQIYQKHHKTIIETFDGETRLAYRHALGALVTVLKADFGLKVGLPVEQGSTFVSAVGAEMGIESCNSSCGVK